MDDQTLENLLSAYRASPDNIKLLVVLLEAYLERDDATQGFVLLDGQAPDTFTEAKEACLAARVALAARQDERALAYAQQFPDDAHANLLAARALLGLGRNPEGRESYEKAVKASAALEDPVLGKALNAKLTEARVEAGRPRLRVISNDDTDQSELERLIQAKAEEIKFADVGGLDDIKSQIHKRIILPFQKPSLFAKFKKRVGGGILMYGPPGCGKTLLARATAGECDAAFLNVSIADVLDMYIGESEQKLHALFEKARAMTPSVLFFDEIEALGGKRQYTREATASKLVSQFLSEMDGFTKNNEGVLVLGATNVPWAVDPAFRRPGRFDRVLFVPPPDELARERILELLISDRPVEERIDLAGLAKRTSGYSGADLQNVIETAADAAIEASIEAAQEVPIATVHLQQALSETRTTTLEWLTTARNYARYANESGHYDEVLEFLKRHGKD